MFDDNLSVQLKDAISLTRVSSYKQRVQGESFDVQDKINNQIAPARGYQIVKTFYEEYSGRKEKRPKLEEVFDYLRANPNIQAVFFRDIDRLTRGGATLYGMIKKELQSMGIELFDTSGVIQPVKNTLHELGFEYDWSMRSPSQLNEVIRAENANEEVSTILTRMIGQEIRLAKRGYSVRQANFGYQNKKIEDLDGTKKTICEPHPQESRWIIRMFELRAKGVLNDKQICEEINATGFKTRITKVRDKETKEVIGIRGGIQLTPKQLQKFIKNPIYCGVRVEKWTNGKPIKTQFEGLVSTKLFNKANKGNVKVGITKHGISVEYGQEKKPRILDNPTYPLRFVVKCPVCGNNLIGSASRGKGGKKYPAYHCTHRGHYFRIPLAQFHETVHDYVDSLKMEEGVYTIVSEMIMNQWEARQKEKQSNEREKEKYIKELKIKQSLLLDKIISTSSDIVQKKLETEIEELENQINSVKVNQKKSLTKAEIKKFSKKIKEYTEHPAKLLINTDGEAKREEIWNLFFDELPTYENLLNGTPKLSLEMELFKQSHKGEVHLADQLELNWNTLEEKIRKWSEL